MAEMRMKPRILASFGVPAGYVHFRCFHWPTFLLYPFLTHETNLKMPSDRELVRLYPDELGPLDYFIGTS